MTLESFIGGTWVSKKKRKKKYRPVTRFPSSLYTTTFRFHPFFHPSPARTTSVVSLTEVTRMHDQSESTTRKPIYPRRKSFSGATEPHVCVNTHTARSFLYPRSCKEEYVYIWRYTPSSPTKLQRYRASPHRALPLLPHSSHDPDDAPKSTDIRGMRHATTGAFVHVSLKSDVNDRADCIFFTLFFPSYISGSRLFVCLPCCIFLTPLHPSSH